MNEPERLAAQAHALNENIARLKLSVEQLDRRAGRSERVTLAVTLGLLLDLVLSVVAAFLLSTQYHTNDRLEEAIDREARTRQDALCPLYSLIVGSYNPNSRPEGPARDAYNGAFTELRAAYEVLECTSPVVPPRIPG